MSFLSFFLSHDRVLCLLEWSLSQIHYQKDLFDARSCQKQVKYNLRNVRMCRVDHDQRMFLWSFCYHVAASPWMQIAFHIV